MVHDPVLHLEDRLADVRCARRIPVLQRAPDHRGDDAVLADIALVQRLDRLAVAQDGDAVGDLADLVELVGDQDRGNSLRPEFHEQRQQRVAVLFAQAGGRFVEDQQLHFLGQRLGDLDQLLLADADIGDQRIGIFLEPDLRQKCCRLLADRVPVDDAVARLLVAEKDVLGDRKQRHQREFLVDDDDAHPLAVMDALEVAFLAHVMDFAGVAPVRIDPRKHLHQRGFAGAVFADDGVDLA